MNMQFADYDGFDVAVHIFFWTAHSTISSVSSDTETVFPLYLLFVCADRELDV